MAETITPRPSTWNGAQHIPGRIVYERSFAGGSDFFAHAPGSGWLWKRSDDGGDPWLPIARNDVPADVLRAALALSEAPASEDPS